MSVQYDSTKAAANLRAHGVSFSDAEGVLFDPLAVTIEDFSAIGERRYVSLGHDHASVRRAHHDHGPDRA